jgi:general secretion pathway protein M
MSATSGLSRWWQSRAPRERRLLVVGGAVLGVYLLWTALWQPSWQVLREADAQRARGLQVLTRLNAMRDEATHWRAQAPITVATRNAAVQSLAQAAQVELTRVPRGWRVNIQQWTPEQLSQWLADVHNDAQVDIGQSQLTQSDGRWSGWMQLDTEAQP